MRVPEKKLQVVPPPLSLFSVNPLFWDKVQKNKKKTFFFKIRESLPSLYVNLN